MGHRIGWNLIDVDPKVLSGTFFHTQRWLRALGAHDGEHEHICYATQPFYDACAQLMPMDGLTWDMVPSLSASRLRLQRECFFAKHRKRLSRELDALVSMHAAPFCYRGPTISIIMDCVAQRCPHEFPLSWRMYSAASRRKSKGSLGWLTTTQFVQDELAALRGWNREKMAYARIPIPDAPSQHLSADELRQRLKIDRPFIFYCSTITPRKNHRRLIAAFRQAFPGREALLVLAGDRGWKSDAPMRDVSLAESDGFLRYLGRVDDATRYALYAHSQCGVYPSLYEGFGMPVVESFQCGKTLLVTQDSPMTEIGGDAVYPCDSTNVDDIAMKLRQLFDDEPLRVSLEEKSSAALGPFSYAQVGKDLSQALTKLLS